MSALETRLREALEFGVDDAVGIADLGAGARTRLAARRRRRAAGAAVAGVLAAGLGLTMLVGDDPAPVDVPPPAGGWPTSSGGVDAPAGWHVEQWRGVSIHVPNTWGSGALSEWCERGPLLGVPVVERPGEPGSAKCSEPELGFGVQFLDPRRTKDLESYGVRRPRPREAAIYPQGAWVGVTCAHCDVAVRVVAPDVYVARYLLSSYARSPDAPADQG